jgi:hypothetical protein
VSELRFRAPASRQKFRRMFLMVLDPPGKVFGYDIKIDHCPVSIFFSLKLLLSICHFKLLNLKIIQLCYVIWNIQSFGGKNGGKENT